MNARKNTQARRKKNKSNAGKKRNHQHESAIEMAVRKWFTEP